MNEIKEKRPKKAIESYIMKNSCVLCGMDRIDSGKIFKGHCICNDCHKLICAMPIIKVSDISAAAETPDKYLHH